MIATHQQSAHNVLSALPPRCPWAGAARSAWWAAADAARFRLLARKCVAARPPLPLLAAKNARQAGKSHSADIGTLRAAAASGGRFFPFYCPHHPLVSPYQSVLVVRWMMFQTSASRMSTLVASVLTTPTSTGRIPSPILCLNPIATALSTLCAQSDTTVRRIVWTSSSMAITRRSVGNNASGRAVLCVPFFTGVVSSVGARRGQIGNWSQLDCRDDECSTGVATS